MKEVTIILIFFGRVRAIRFQWYTLSDCDYSHAVTFGRI